MNPTVTQAILQDRKISYFITNHQFQVTEISDAVGVFEDTAYQTIVGRDLLDLVPELVGSEAALQDILNGTLSRLELSLVNLEMIPGQTVYLMLVNLPYRDAVGQIKGLIHVVQDVTEIGQVQQQLAQHRNELRLLRDQLTRQNEELTAANAELSRLGELKSKFVSIAAHELQTPLTTINGFVEVLLDVEVGPLTTDQREYLEIVQRSAHRLVNIVRNLLDVTRIEAGRIELVLKPKNLEQLIRDLSLEFKPQLDAKSQTFKLVLTPNLPFGLCDEARVAQILGNLVSNAIKYTPEEGRVGIKLSLAKEEGFIQISVRDNGIGISAEDQIGLFKRFFRAGNAGLTGATGTGLGLHITRSLVELHGGEIWFESALNQGTTFSFTLPVAEPTTLSDNPHETVLAAVDRFNAAMSSK